MGEAVGCHGSVKTGRLQSQEERTFRGQVLTQGQLSGPGRWVGFVPQAGADWTGSSHTMEQDHWCFQISHV